MTNELDKTVVVSVTIFAVSVLIPIKTRNPPIPSNAAFTPSRLLTNCLKSISPRRSFARSFRRSVNSRSPVKTMSAKALSSGFRIGSHNGSSAERRNSNAAPRRSTATGRASLIVHSPSGTRTLFHAHARPLLIMSITGDRLSFSPANSVLTFSTNRMIPSLIGASSNAYPSNRFTPVPLPLGSFSLLISSKPRS